MSKATGNLPKAGECARRLCSELLEAVFPSNIYCIGCGAIIDRTMPYALCSRCVREFHWVTEPVGEDVYCCVRYGLYEREIVKSFKFRDRAYYGEKMAEMMYDRIEPEELPLDLVTAVPLYRKNLQHRGYNQAELLAEPLARRLGIPYEPQLLVKERSTGALSKMDAVQRRWRAAGAYGPGRRCEAVYGKRVLLIDDVYTTGSTAGACRQILQAAGAAAVFIFCFASNAEGGRKPEE